MSNAYEDIQRSLLHYCKCLLERYSITGFEVFDFDGHATEQDFPDSDLIGVAEYSIQNDKDMHTVTCMLVVSTKSDDVQLKRLRPVVGKMYSELSPGATGEKFQIVDDTGLKRGYMTVKEGVMVGPVGTTKTRPVQAIAVSLGAGYAQLPI